MRQALYLLRVALWVAFSLTSRAASLPIVELGHCGEFEKTTRMYHLMDFAAKIALEEGFLDAQVPNRSFTIRIRTASTMCTSSLASPLTLPLLLGVGQESGRIHSVTEEFPPVLAISGCSCSSVSAIVSQLAAPLQVPIISGASTSPSLSNKALHPYFSRTCSPDSKQGAGLAALTAYFASIAPNGGWTRVVLVYDQDTYGEGIADAFVESELMSSFTIFRVPLTYMLLKSAEDAASYDFSPIISAAEEVAAYSPQPRVFIAAVAFLQAVSRPFDSVGLWHKLSVVFTVDEGCATAKMSAINDNVEAYYAASVEAESESAAWWTEGAYDWTRTPTVLDGMMCLLLNVQGARYKSEEFANFWGNMTREKFLDAGMPSDYYTDTAWFEDFTMMDAKIWYPLIFDAMTALLVSIGTLLADGVDASELTGEALQEAILNVRFEGLTGNVAFDSNGDRLAPYNIMNLQSGEVVEVGLFDSATGDISFSSDWSFGENISGVPADRPDSCAAGSEYNSSACRLCSPGYFSPAEDSTCLQCPAGTYSASEGSSACASAPPGSHVPEAGQTEATLCGLGYASSEIGAEFCSPCSTGVYTSVQGATECVWCAKGSYADRTASTTCAACPTGETTAAVAAESEADCICKEGSYRASENTSCLACIEGMSCPEGSIAKFGDSGDPHPLVLEGYMSLAAEPMHIYRCLQVRHCPGGDPGLCGSNRDPETVACGECLEDHYDTGTSCEHCEGSFNWSFVILAGVLAFLALVLATLLASSEAIKTTKSTLVCVAVGGLMLTSLQTLGVLDSLSVVWLEPIKSILSFMKLFSFNLEVLQIQCISSGTEFSYCIRQLIVPAAIPVVYVVIRAKQRLMDSRMKVVPEFVNVTGSLLNVFFISVVVSCVAPFVCYAHPGDDGYSMRSAPAVLCFDSSAHTKMVIWGCISFLIVPIPFLCLVLFGVLKYKDMVRGRCSELYLRGLRFLFVRYHPERHYYTTIALFKSLIVCLVPVLVQNGASQIMILMLVVILFHTAQVYLQPWRGDLPNSVEAGSNVALLLLLTAGALLAGLTVETDTVQVLATVAFVCGWVGVLAVLTQLAVRLLMYRGFVYAVFICHHKAGAAAQARMLKMAIQSHNKGEVFIDSDNLKDLDTLFGIVKTQVKTMAIYLTKNTLRRPWCAGEVATAVHASKARVVAVYTSHFEPPTEDELQDVRNYVDSDGVDLQKYSISFDLVSSAFRKLLGQDMNKIVLSHRLVTDTAYDDLARQILRDFSTTRASSFNVGSTSSSKGSNQILLPDNDGQFLICAERQNDEAVAAAGILARKMRVLLMHSQENVQITSVHEYQPGIEGWPEAVEKAVEGARSLIFLLSNGTMQDQEQLFIMLIAMELKQQPDHDLLVAPMVLPGFHFPSPTYFETTLPSLMTPHPEADNAELARNFFKLIASPLSIDASDSIIDVQVSDVATRIPTSMRSRNARMSRLSSTGTLVGDLRSMRTSIANKSIYNADVREI